MSDQSHPVAADGERALPEEIASAIEAYGKATFSFGRTYIDSAVKPAHEALTTSILSRLTAAEAENTRLHERLEDKTNSIRVEITAKLAAYNDIKLLEAEARKAADAMESVAKKLPAYSPPAETLSRRAWCLRALLSEAQPKGDQ